MHALTRSFKHRYFEEESFKNNNAVDGDRTRALSGKWRVSLLILVLFGSIRELGRVDKASMVRVTTYNFLPHDTQSDNIMFLKSLLKPAMCFISTLYVLKSLGMVKSGESEYIFTRDSVMPHLRKFYAGFSLLKV